MSFKKGDKVWMISTSSAGIIVPSMQGTVTAVSGSSQYATDKMMVKLKNGHTVIHDTEDDPSSLVIFRKDWGC
jgi:co-chaperonin GroES (HSP10)